MGGTMAKKSKQAPGLLADVRDLPLESFRLPGDGPKMRGRARDRQHLALYLATFDRSVGEAEIRSRFGWTRAKTVFVLGDLSGLGLAQQSRNTIHFRSNTISPTASAAGSVTG